MGIVFCYLGKLGYFYTWYFYPFVYYRAYIYLMQLSMFEQYEKKLNKILLDVIIGGSYMGDYGQHLAEDVKQFFIDAYEHLVEQWEWFKKRYRE
jgi:hypothetical protein